MTLRTRHKVNLRILKTNLRKFCDQLTQPNKYFPYLKWDGGPLTWVMSDKTYRLLCLLEKLHPRRIVKKQLTTPEGFLKEIEEPVLESTKTVTVIFVQRRVTTTTLKLLLKKYRPEITAECLVSPNISSHFKFKKQNIFSASEVFIVLFF